MIPDLITKAANCVKESDSALLRSARTAGLVLLATIRVSIIQQRWWSWRKTNEISCLNGHRALACWKYNYLFTH